MARLKTLSKNENAFLDMIAWSEIGSALLANPATDDGYRVMVGSTPGHPLLFTSYATHPNVLNRETDSTAAGRYQLLYRYYVAYADKLGLKDFSPESQDAIAIQQIREREAIPLINTGNIEAAVLNCNNIWASLYGSPYGQHTNSMADLLAQYIAAGGGQ